MQCSAMQRVNAMKCNAIRCNAMQWVNALPKTTSNQQLWLWHWLWLWTVRKPYLFPILSDAIVISRPMDLYTHCPKCYSLSHTCTLCHLSEIVSQVLWWSVFVEKHFARFQHRLQFMTILGAIRRYFRWQRVGSLHPPFTSSIPNGFVIRLQMDLWSWL